MAVVGPQEASSSTFRCSYHVFLSFRGKDTRETFTDHLYTALVHAGFHTFRDDDELQRGENIESKLHQAIKESKISIVVFSTNYASSRWCLNELLKILECQKTSNHIIFPVFYHVLPNQVRFQTESFAEAFAKHVEREGMEKVERWKAALKEVTNLSGRVFTGRKEAKFIQSIVKEIGHKLNRKVLSVAPYPIGIDSLVSPINQWVQDGSNDVNILVIYGIGGIGKTTIAKTVYNLNFEMFDGSSFLANIGEVSKDLKLQKQLLLNILGGTKQKIYNVHEGAIKIRDALSYKKILLVLDDVDQLNRLDTLLGMQDFFYPGTKIIITTRCKDLLKSHKVCKTYKVQTCKVKELENDESLELFSWHAFGQDFPKEGYMELSQGVLKHCGGLPLALQVLGSSLHGKSSDIWESELKKLKTIHDGQILKKLKISYDSLQDDHDKRLFLDIACFFVGMDKDYITTILDACNFCTKIGIQNLIDRCLLIIDVKNKLTMHQLLRDMGREIVRQESPEEPGKRSRLWSYEDVLNVLREKTGTKKIKGLIFNSHMSEEENLGKTSLDPKKRKRQNINESTDKYVSIHEANNPSKQNWLGFFSSLPTKSTSTESFSMPDEMVVETGAFSAMQRLRLLQLNNARVCGGFGEFPRTLKWLRWRGFSLRSIPPNFHLENLVALDMRYSSMKLVWRGTTCLRLLKILDLSYSHSLIRTPDFSLVPNLERLILKSCESLVQVHETIGCLERLIFCNLKGCKNLKKLPQSIGLLKSLKTLILVDCSGLELERMQSLTVFHAGGINQLPSEEAKSRNSSLWSWLSRAKPLKFSLTSLPHSLVDLSLAGCNLSDDAFMIGFGGMPLLQKLDLSRNSICSLPEGINGLNMLYKLVLHTCKKLQSLPELPSSLQDLSISGCSSLRRMSNLPNRIDSLNINALHCGELVEIRGRFKLEPIGNFDIHMVNNLGLSDLERLQGVEIMFWNDLTMTVKKGPIQGLDEFGIFSTFIPGSDVPGCYSIKNSGNAISFTVTSLCDFEIRGLNIFVVYADVMIPSYLFPLCIKIINKSKGTRWVYCPTFFGIPEANQDMIWLSHWEFGNKLGFGDEVVLSVVPFLGVSDIRVADKVKEFGIQLVYCERGDKSSESPTNSNLSQCNVIGGDLSLYETTKGSKKYLLSLHPHSLAREIKKENPLFHNLTAECLLMNVRRDLMAEKIFI